MTVEELHNEYKELENNILKWETGKQMLGCSYTQARVRRRELKKLIEARFIDEVMPILKKDHPKSGTYFVAWEAAFFIIKISDDFDPNIDIEFCPDIREALIIEKAKS